MTGELRPGQAYVLAHARKSSSLLYVIIGVFADHRAHGVCRTTVSAIKIIDGTMKVVEWHPDDPDVDYSFPDRQGWVKL